MTTANATVPISRCDVCPGVGKCGYERAMANSGKLENAYANGCRLPEANAANTAKMRARRARLRGEPADQSGAWSEAETVPAREPTGDSCARCGERLYWERGRGAAICKNRHWELAPGTIERVNANRKTRVRETRDVRAEIHARVELDVIQSELLAACSAALAELDTGQLREAATALTMSETWNEANATRYRAVFKSLSSQISRAETASELQTLTDVFRSYHDSPEYAVVRGLINQGYTDITQALNYRMQGMNNPARFRYMPSPNRIVQVSADNQVNGNRVVTGKVIPKALPPANGDEDEYDNDEDEYDDDDYPRDRGYSTIISAPDSGYIMLAKTIMDARAMRRAQRERNGECAYKAYHNIFNDDVAKQWVTGLKATWNGQYGRASEQIYVCGNRKCIERAGQYFIDHGYDDYESGKLD